MGGGKGGQTAEVYDFLMSLDYAICHGPIDALNALVVKDKIAWQVPVEKNAVVKISEKELFGGDDAEGGMVGTMEVYLGGWDQYASPELAVRFGLASADCVGYRGLAHLFFRGSLSAANTSDYDHSGTDGGMTVEDAARIVLGKMGLMGAMFLAVLGPGAQYGFKWTTNNPYLPAPVPHVSRRPRGLSADGWIWPIIKRENGEFIQSTSKLNPDDERTLNRRKCPDANPAHMIYEIMTNEEWGKGDPASAFNKQSYLDCAAVLKDEMFGLSMMLSGQDAIENFVSEILDHIKGMQYQDPTTGLWTLKLIRDDYTKADLRVFNETNCDATVRRRTWSEVINQIRVTYTEPFSEEEEAVTVENMAAVAIQGGVVSETRDYYGVRNKFLAQQIAERDLAEASRLLTTVKMTVDREGFDQVPGGVVVFSWAEENIVEMVCRINTVDWGSSTDRKIQIEMTEDIFSTPKMDFSEPQEAEFIEDSDTPKKADHIFITGTPFPLLTRNGYSLTEIDDNYPQSTAMFFVNDNTMSIIDVVATSTVVDGNGDTSLGQVSKFPASATSTLGLALVPEVRSEIPAGLLEGMLQAEAEIGDIFMIQSATSQEWLMVDAYNSANGTWWVIRGLWDTVPQTWAATDRVWGVNGTLTNTDDREIFYLDNLTYYMRPRTRDGRLARTSADATAYTVQRRIHAPFRPANTQINGQGFGGQQYLAGVFPAAIPVTWNNRNRTSEDAVAKKWNAATVTPETGQTTRIKMIDAASGTVEFVYDGLTGTSFNLNTDDFTTYRFYTVGFYAVRDGIESIQGAKRFLEVERLGWGNNFGYDWGENDG
ncbi:hypothetical protein LOKG_00038 [Loktanella phage pCB2051-A]|uniref:Tip attachment protein J domain-containing protein n=1 Tax=Loktanella phage pCB2051-A TaxID=754044 RepID=M4QSZ3_9CAUD|nr:tail protein [Loktanella phage pCB2051-A]AGH31474.1 hypothetical protein LOKG_00038 [Loktanella phage pCB2051-A]